MKQNGNIVIYILIGVAVVLIGGYYYFSNLPKHGMGFIPSPSSTIQTSSLISLASVWQMGTNTYSNPKIDITFEYPKSFIKNEIDTIKENQAYKQQYPGIKEDIYGDFFVAFHTPDIPVEERNKTGFDWNTYSVNSMSVTVDEYNNPNNLSVQDFIKSRFTSLGVDGKTPGYVDLLSGLKKFNVPNNNAYLYEGSAGGENPKKIVFFSYKNKIYKLTLVGGNNTGEKYSPQAETVFNQLLASIKLL